VEIMSIETLDSLTPTFLSLRHMCPMVSGSTMCKTFMNRPEGRVVMFAMDSGQEMSEHRTPFAAMIHVLEGRLLICVEGEEREMVPDQMLIMPANALHRLRALVPTRMLLTVFKSGADRALSCA